MCDSTRVVSDADLSRFRMSDSILTFGVVFSSLSLWPGRGLSL